MELDKTQIVLRERNWLDILDLALRVVRQRLLPVLGAAAIGIIPFALLNYWLTSELAEMLLDEELESEELVGNWIGYLFLLAMLVLWETPLATAPLTLYLGQITFTQKFEARRAAGEFVRSLPQLIVLQVIVRGLLLPLMFTWFFPFVLWPYLNEIILLERGPLFRWRSKGVATTLSRISSLHSPNTGDLMGRAFASALLAPFLVFALWSSLWVLHSLMSERFAIGPAAVNVYLQLAVWSCVTLFAVARFLAYLDLRTRNEGWELELRMRAEGLRLTPKVAA